jgi:hypothetical protein
MKTKTQKHTAEICVKEVLHVEDALTGKIYTLESWPKLTKRQRDAVATITKIARGLFLERLITGKPVTLRSLVRSI